MLPSMMIVAEGRCMHGPINYSTIKSGRFRQLGRTIVRNAVLCTAFKPKSLPTNLTRTQTDMCNSNPNMHFVSVWPATRMVWRYPTVQFVRTYRVLRTATIDACQTHPHHHLSSNSIQVFGLIIRFILLHAHVLVSQIQYMHQPHCQTKPQKGYSLLVRYRTVQLCFWKLLSSITTR